MPPAQKDPFSGENRAKIELQIELSNRAHHGVHLQHELFGLKRPQFPPQQCPSQLTNLRPFQRSPAVCRFFPSFLIKMHGKKAFSIENHRKKRKEPDPCCFPTSVTAVHLLSTRATHPHVMAECVCAHRPLPGLDPEALDPARPRSATHAPTSLSQVWFSFGRPRGRGIPLPPPDAPLAELLGCSFRFRFFVGIFVLTLSASRAAAAAASSRSLTGRCRGACPIFVCHAQS